MMREGYVKRKRNQRGGRRTGLGGIYCFVRGSLDGAAAAYFLSSLDETCISNHAFCKYFNIYTIFLNPES